MARACGSYPQCPRFKSRCRYQIHEAPRGASWILNGPLVKWLRHGPFTAVTWVRVPYGSPHGNPSRVAEYGGLAQLVRAPASHAGGHWFESSSLHQKVPDFVRNQELFLFISSNSDAAFWRFSHDPNRDPRYERSGKHRTGAERIHSPLLSAFLPLTLPD